MSPFTRSVVFLSIFILLSPIANAKSLEEKRWYVATSENFTIHSRLSKKKSIEVLKRLEVLRALLGKYSGINVETRIPTQIIFTADSRELRKIYDRKGIAGIFASGIRSNVILMHGADNVDTRLVVQHEYTHYLMSGMARHYPRWYEEGFADYIGSTRIVGDSVQVFRRHEVRERWLRYYGVLHADELLDPLLFRNLDTDDLARFYATSWLLVHFLNNRPASAPSIADGLASYFSLVEAGEDHVSAFETAFQFERKSLRHELAKYYDHTCCAYGNIPIDDLVPGFSAEIDRVDARNVAFKLGRIALGAENFEQAKRWFEIAIQDPALRARATSSLAVIAAEQEQFDEAEVLAKDAMSLSPEDPQILVDYSTCLILRARLLQGDPSMNGYLDSAQEALIKVAKMGSPAPEFYVNLGQVLLLRGEKGNDATSYLEVAKSLLPSVQSVQMLLARSYEKDGRYSEALSLARGLETWSHGNEEIVHWATVAIARIEAAEHKKAGQ